MTENVSQVSVSLPSNIQAQIEQKHAGRRKHVFHGGCLCSRCLTNPPEPGDRYCKPCRNSYSAQRKRDERLELKELRASRARSEGVTHGT